MKPTQLLIGQASRRRIVLQASALLVMVIGAYMPALTCGFLWDDDQNVTQNPALRSWDGLRRIWLEPGATQQYYPLTHTSFWIDYHLWGTNPLPYHLENVLLHAFSAILLWCILMRLRAPGAWLGAALFALHPVCVESVAWISQRKNTLCGVFFLASIFAAVKWWLPETPGPGANRKSQSLPVASSCGPWKYYWAALGLYLCALWAKTAVVGLPGVIVLLIWWKRGRLRKRGLVLLTPFLAVGMAISLITIKVEAGLGASQANYPYSMMERTVTAGRAVWFYLGKLAWPHPLVFMYSRWQVQASRFVTYVPLLMIGAGLCLLWWRRNSWGRPALVAAGCFLVMLFPVLGFFNQTYFSYSWVADHFQYFACIGPLALAGAGLVLAARYLGRQKVAVEWMAYGILAVLGVLTWRQIGPYRNLETLWSDVIAHDPGSWGGHYNLGLVLVGQEKIDEGIEQYHQALQGNPGYAAIHDNLGNALARQGKLDEAIEQYTSALAMQPDYANGHNNLGNILLQRGDVDGAIQHYVKALQTDPNFADVHYNFGNALLRKRDMDGAIDQYRRALQSKPDYAMAHFKLANVLAIKGEQEEALKHYRLAVELDPRLIYARLNLANLLAARSQFDAAIEQYIEVLRLKPDFAEAQSALGDVLVAKGRWSDAVERYRQALQINPNQPETCFHLGMALLKLGRVDAAREQFAEAVRLQPGYGEAEQQLRALSAMTK